MPLEALKSQCIPVDAGGRVWKKTMQIYTPAAVVVVPTDTAGNEPPRWGPTMSSWYDAAFEPGMYSPAVSNIVFAAGVYTFFGVGPDFSGRACYASRDGKMWYYNGTVNGITGPVHNMTYTNGWFFAFSGDANATTYVRSQDLINWQVFPIPGPTGVYKGIGYIRDDGVELLFMLGDVSMGGSSTGILLYSEDAGQSFTASTALHSGISMHFTGIAAYKSGVVGQLDESCQGCIVLSTTGKVLATGRNPTSPATTVIESGMSGFTSADCLAVADVDSNFYKYIMPYGGTSGQLASGRTSTTYLVIQTTTPFLANPKLEVEPCGNPVNSVVVTHKDRNILSRVTVSTGLSISNISPGSALGYRFGSSYVYRWRPR